MDKLKKGILIMLVGMAMIGVMASSVSSEYFDYAGCMDSSGDTGYSCDAFIGDTGWCIGYCTCSSYIEWSIYVNCYYVDGWYEGWNCDCNS